jgi:hypothetical protein
VKVYTSRPTTPQEPTESAPAPIVTPRVTFQQGSVTIDLPIRKAEEAKEWVDKLSTLTPSLDLYKRKLKAFIDWEVADGVIKNQENKALRQAQANKKERSKKTLLLTVIDADSWDEIEEQLLKKENNKKNKKRNNTGPKNSRKGKQPQPQLTNQSSPRGRGARGFDTLSESSLEELPQLPIQEKAEATVEENSANEQLATELSASIEPARPFRARRKPIRFRD